jgi:(1->4)-alpha-D-glucan 1-alpha-D-glucosylmutase
VARLGALNSLAQLVLKLVSPGVVDTYQGCELWDLHLVDPDNRRRVDFGLRRRMLDELEGYGAADEVRPALLAELLASWPDGRLKMFVLARGLRLRRERTDLFLEGDSEGLDTTGERAEHVVASARRNGGGLAIAVAPRLARALATDGHPFPLGARAWGDTRILVPQGVGALRDAFSGARRRADAAGGLLVADVLDRWPVALLVSEPSA